MENLGNFAWSPKSNCPAITYIANGSPSQQNQRRWSDSEANQPHSNLLPRAVMGISKKLGRIRSSHFISFICVSRVDDASASAVTAANGDDVEREPVDEVSQAYLGLTRHFNKRRRHPHLLRHRVSSNQTRQNCHLYILIKFLSHVCPRVGRSAGEPVDLASGSVSRPASERFTLKSPDPFIGRRHFSIIFSHYIFHYHRNNQIDKACIWRLLPIDCRTGARTRRRRVGLTNQKRHVELTSYRSLPALIRPIASSSDVWLSASLTPSGTKQIRNLALKRYFYRNPSYFLSARRGWLKIWAQKQNT